jgi:hypothetical protein
MSASSGDLFAYLAERLIARVEQEPITVTIVFADGVHTFEIGPGDPWYKPLSQRRSEALRASLAKRPECHEFKTSSPADLSCSLSN